MIASKRDPRVLIFVSSISGTGCSSKRRFPLRWCGRPRGYHLFQKNYYNCCNYNNETCVNNVNATLRNC